MVQDISSPEIYLSRLPDGRCGGWNLYQDHATSTPANIDFCDLRECSVFWAITVPGESHWRTKQLEGPLFGRGKVYHLLPLLILIVRTVVPEIPSRAPYLTSHNHKLPNPQSPDFGILLKVVLDQPFGRICLILLHRYTTKA